MVFLCPKPNLCGSSLAVAVGIMLFAVPAMAQDAGKVCKSARFKSAWDETIDVLATVKSGVPCTIKLPLTNVGKAVIVRNARLGKTEQVADTADMTFTPNNSVSGLDVFVYEIERTENDKPVKNRIRVEMSVLKAKDYPSERAYKDEPLPESSETKPQTADKEAAKPAPAK